MQSLPDTTRDRDLPAARPRSSRTTRPFVEGLCRAASPHHPERVMSVGRDGASDAVSFLGAGVPAVEFGPVGDGHHGPEEWVSVSSLGSLPQRARGLRQALPGDGPRLMADEKPKRTRRRREASRAGETEEYALDDDLGDRAIRETTPRTTRAMTPTRPSEPLGRGGRARGDHQRRDPGVGRHRPRGRRRRTTDDEDDDDEADHDEADKTLVAQARSTITSGFEAVGRQGHVGLQGRQGEGAVPDVGPVPHRGFLVIVSPSGPRPRRACSSISRGHRRRPRPRQGVRGHHRSPRGRRGRGAADDHDPRLRQAARAEGRRLPRPLRHDDAAPRRPRRERARALLAAARPARRHPRLRQRQAQRRIRLRRAGADAPDGPGADQDAGHP